MDLIQQLKQARIGTVKTGGFTFTYRRPTDLEVAQLRQSDRVRESDILERFVTDWAGVSRADIVPGMDAGPVPFDTEIFMEWIADRPDLWPAIVEAIMTAYWQHLDQLAAAKKKPATG